MGSELDKMKIIDAQWYADVNRYEIMCNCGTVFWARVDRWTPICPNCKRVGNLAQMRETIELKGGN